MGMGENILDQVAHEEGEGNIGDVGGPGSVSKDVLSTVGESTCVRVVKVESGGNNSAGEPKVAVARDEFGPPQPDLFFVFFKR